MRILSIIERTVRGVPALVSRARVGGVDIARLDATRLPQIAHYHLRDFPATEEAGEWLKSLLLSDPGRQ
jgi:hypothetical protein